ncbi:O-antigen ligase family protein [Paenarthrobacter ureafaciens]|uniref:O-antigen ligase family protein n=1 Tax=Paenarthrobacter ureafaciens TaxID=37931 RepID=UPI001FB3872B|nr:O-antigen ligase family protein [Paenarthrobacter ureafaciens]UOD79538.1 O-antigen ligase family protein [Paenarthrobacter ureafaciens]WNZ02892.1 O-antigen ligase family protein [Paenarthrobacter ureafaciens]
MFRVNALLRREGLRGSSPGASDATAFLTIYILLTCALPSNLVISSLGSIGRPSNLFALAGFGWWVLHQFTRVTPTTTRRHPLRVALTVFLLVALASYAFAMLRGLPDTEASPADAGLLRLAGWAGVLLVAVDGLRTRENVRSVIRCVAVVGGLTAALGLLQSATGSSLIDWIRIPGLSLSSELANIDSRGGFIRAAGMAVHPLEYGVVLSTSLPLAITLALTGSGKRRNLWWIPVGLIAVAAMLSVSRAALICMTAAFIVLLFVWPKAIRRSAIMLVALLVAIIYVASPGMLGTLFGLFTVGTNDPSISSRTNGYSTAFGMISQHLFMGRGFGTFLPAYVIVDNQYLGLLVELGIAGLAAFLGLIAAGAYCAWRARRMAGDDSLRQTSQAMLASIVAAGIANGFFDALSFPMAAGLMFVLLGTAGALYRIAPEG